MAKKIVLETGRTFETVKSANEHFASILKRQGIEQKFAGEEFSDILAIYNEYCSRTGWALPSSPATFYPTHNVGVGYTTLCFGVTFSDGSKATFSMEKALRAIAS